MRCAERENAGKGDDSAIEFPIPCPIEVTDPARLVACADLGERLPRELETLVSAALEQDDPALLRISVRALVAYTRRRAGDARPPSPRAAALLARVRAALAGKP